MDSMNRIAQYEKIAVQKEVMPAASAQNVGKVYQYVGETTGSLTKGMFYEVVSTGSWYSYQVINMGEGASAISQLTDVELTNIQDGEILKYDSASSKFINATDAGGVSTLVDLTDTTITTPTDGQVLKYNSTSSKWINAEDSEGQIIQVATMPANPEQDRIVQYIGTTNANYTNGYFYKAGQLIYDETVSTLPVADHLAQYNGKTIYVEDEQKTYAVSTTTATYPCLWDDETPGIVTLGWVMDLVPGATIFEVDISTSPNTPLDIPIGTVDSIGTLIGDTQRYNCTLRGESREMYAKSPSRRPTGTKYVATENSIYGWVRVDVQPEGTDTDALADLTDTNITSPTDGQVLTYNGSEHKWKNVNASSGGTPTNFSGGLKTYDTTTDDYSAIQWPCPAGFHIPTVAEATILYSVFTALQQTDNDFVMPVLHVTAGGMGYASGGAITWETTEDLEYRWTVDTDGTDTTQAKSLKMTWRYGREVEREYKAQLLNIRPFRNGYLPADSTWTLVAGSLNWAYVAENTTLGLISLHNGTAGVTIANKNVWATVVYDGSTRDATTTGTYFQRGNNYGFTYNEAPASTTSTQVDTSSYSDSTYSSSICYVGDQQDWSTANNANLWWATTGVVPWTVTAKNVVCAVSWLPPLPALETWDMYTYTLQADHSTGEWVISWVQTN